MPTIQIPDAQFQRLTEQATAAGYEDVAVYIEKLLSEPALDPRCGLSEEELRQSAVECDEALARMKREGGGLDFREAWLEMGQKMGFKPTQ